MARKVKPAHYRGTYHVESRKVREAAKANPFTRCWRCGQPARHGDPWQAGHVRDGDPASPLLPEHRSCNTAAGARLTNRKRKVRAQRTELTW